MHSFVEFIEMKRMSVKLIIRSPRASPAFLNANEKRHANANSVSVFSLVRGK